MVTSVGPELEESQLLHQTTPMNTIEFCFKGFTIKTTLENLRQPSASTDPMKVKKVGVSVKDTMLKAPVVHQKESMVL